MSAPHCGSPCRRAGRNNSACVFKVEWQINPHMKIGAVDPCHAARQHGALARLLGGLGAVVDGVPFIHGAYDSVFIKDNAVLIRRDGLGQALLARPRHRERRMEQHKRHQCLLERGFIVHAPEDASFEGGDVVVLPGNRGVLLGTGFRSFPCAAQPLARFTGARVHVLTLRDPALYHLDTALSVLSDGTLVHCPEAFTGDSQHALAALFPERDTVSVPYAEALGFAVNVVEVGRHIILGGPSPTLERALRRRGWTVHVPDLREFRRAGGSAACLVARVHDVDQRGSCGNPSVAA
jgi:N-dimethylarginine dimethylaminohydrolase